MHIKKKESTFLLSTEHTVFLMCFYYLFNTKIHWEQQNPNCECTGQKGKLSFYLLVYLLKS